jgi:hypothetical protein
MLWHIVVNSPRSFKEPVPWGGKSLNRLLVDPEDEVDAWWDDWVAITRSVRDPDSSQRVWKDVFFLLDDIGCDLMWLQRVGVWFDQGVMVEFDKALDPTLTDLLDELSSALGTSIPLRLTEGGIRTSISNLFKHARSKKHPLLEAICKRARDTGDKWAAEYGQMGWINV